MVLGDGAGNGLTVLRSFRVIRIFKLLRNWVGLRDIVLALFASLYDISYFMLILLIFVFVYAVLGVQLFRSRFDFGDVENVAVDTRPNFDNLGLGVLSVFQIVTGENWNDLMYREHPRSRLGRRGVLYHNLCGRRHSNVTVSRDRAGKLSPHR